MRNDYLEMGITIQACRSSLSIDYFWLDVLIAVTIGTFADSDLHHHSWSIAILRTIIMPFIVRSALLDHPSTWSKTEADDESPLDRAIYRKRAVRSMHYVLDNCCSAREIGAY
jgi:hypothetical protein